MTAIGTTAYFSSTSYAAARSHSAASADAFADVSEQEDAEKKSSQASRTDAVDPKPAFDSRPSTYTVNFQGQLATLQRLDVKLEAMNISELPEDRYAAFMEGLQHRIDANTRHLQNQYTNHEAPDLSNHPAIKPYATVVVGGRVVATIDNQGVVTSSDADAARMQGRIPDSVNGTNGPDLAQARAEAIAKMFGGRVEKESSALTQGQFNTLAGPPKPETDYKGIRNDPLYAQIQQLMENYAKIQQERAEYVASQQAGVDIHA